MNRLLPYDVVSNGVTFEKGTPYAVVFESDKPDLNFDILVDGQKIRISGYDTRNEAESDGWVFSQRRVVSCRTIKSSKTDLSILKSSFSEEEIAKINSMQDYKELPSIDKIKWDVLNGYMDEGEAYEALLNLGKSKEEAHQLSKSWAEEMTHDHEAITSSFSKDIYLSSRDYEALKGLLGKGNYALESKDGLVFAYSEEPGVVKIKHLNGDFEPMTVKEEEFVSYISETDNNNYDLISPDFVPDNVYLQ